MIEVAPRVGAGMAPVEFFQRLPSVELRPMKPVFCEHSAQVPHQLKQETEWQSVGVIAAELMTRIEQRREQPHTSLLAKQSRQAA
ncbi:MAG: hypothetical protein AAGC70_09355 [Pseudomonadota bacterium]